jgi:branched-chain amino acid transport system substrate-binding protein
MKNKQYIKSIILFGTLFLLFTFVQVTGAQEEKILKWGAIEPLSGSAALWGQAMNQGVKLAAEEVNAKGGLKIGNVRYKIEVIEEDCKYSGTGGASAASKLVYQEGVKYFTGSLASASVLAMQPITEKNQCLVQTNSFADVLGKDKPFTFRMATDVLQGVAGCFLAVKQKYPGQIKRVAIVDANDATGWAAANAVKMASKALGWEVVAEEYFERGGVTDFHPLLGKVLPKKPDLIDFSGTSSIESALIGAHSYEMGYRGKKTGMVIMPDVMAQKGGAGIEEMIGFFGVDYDMPWIAPSQKELYNKFKAKWPGKKMLYQVELAYGATKGALIAIEKAQTLDVPSVVKVLENLSWDHPAGGKAEWVDFDGYGYKGVKRQIGFPHPITELKGGKLYLVTMADLVKIIPQMGIKIEGK